MYIELNLALVANCVSIIVSAFLGVHFLFLRQHNRWANGLLGIFLILTSVSILGSAFEFFRGDGAAWFMTISSPFLLAPILYYYALALSNQLKPRWPKYRWLLVPFAVEVILNVVLSYFVDSDHLGENVLMISAFLSLPFSLYCYFLILKEVRVHNNQILNLFSSIENKQLNWLKLLALINIGFTFIWIVDDGLLLLIGENLVSENIAQLSLFATLITILWIGFAGLRQKSIFEFAAEAITKEEPGSEDLIEVSEDFIIVQEYERVKKHLEVEKNYLDQDLSLRKLASSLNMKEKELTRIINHGFEANFYHFINHYRVAHFKTLIENSNYKYFSIEGLSKEAGFKSKSTFYKAFKAVEGMTPKEYESQINSTESAIRTP